MSATQPAARRAPEPRLVTHDGRTQTIRQWSRETGIPAPNIYGRLYQQGWPPARALSAPVGGAKREVMPRAAMDAGLTARQYAVLSLMAEGLSNSEIARRLGAAESTVKNHTTQIHYALDVHSRVEAILRGIQLGLVEPGGAYAVRDEVAGLFERIRDRGYAPFVGYDAERKRWAAWAQRDRGSAVAVARAYADSPRAALASLWRQLTGEREERR